MKKMLYFFQIGKYLKLLDTMSLCEMFIGIEPNVKYEKLFGDVGYYMSRYDQTKQALGRARWQE